MKNMNTRCHLVGATLCAVFVLWACMAAHAYATAHNSSTPSMPPLTPAEQAVIINKGTERPFSGDLLHTKTSGTYICRQCGAALYRSADKFDSGCGWPSFDDAIAGAVRRLPDADAKRVEILCVQCGGHLGHVFEGEQFTAKNTRHCVNSISMVFVPDTAPPAQGRATAYFAGGCFWGVEDAFEKVDGVLEAVSGYMGGSKVNPTYEEVTTGATGHTETVRVVYDPAKVSYDTLARLFFEIHDPTQKDRQGPDVGTQYRSGIFTTDAAQRSTVDHLIGLLRAKGWNVVTEVAPAETFYPAEAYHQDFTRRTGRGACHLRLPRFDTGPR